MEGKRKARAAKRQRGGLSTFTCNQFPRGVDAASSLRQKPDPQMGSRRVSTLSTIRLPEGPSRPFRLIRHQAPSGVVAACAETHLPPGAYWGRHRLKRRRSPGKGRRELATTSRHLLWKYWSKIMWLANFRRKGAPYTMVCGYLGKKEYNFFGCTSTPNQFGHFWLGAS